jgi:predicted alpha/beta-hydrolase family hydrolase
MSCKFTVDTISIPVDGGEATSGILARPDGSSEKKPGVIVAHGAGNNMHTPFLAVFSEGLARAGYPVLRFNFLYAEHGRKAPDKAAALERTWLAAFKFFKEVLGSSTGSYVAAGKSMGGRIASQMVAESRLSVDRLVFLGYPLHPPGNKEKLRDTHLYQIHIPMLFFAGTRDPLCDTGLLNGVLKNLKAPWEVFSIQGGDHSFHVPKSAGFTGNDVYGRIVTKTIEWLQI